MDEDAYVDDVASDLLTDEVTEELIREGVLLASCSRCGAFLEPDEALGSCPACQVEVWPEHLVVRLVSQLPQC